jgi:hypothetical protein
VAHGRWLRLSAAGDRPQVSWKAIEADAEVIASDGEAAARVSRVVGDPNADVFTGLAVLVGTFSGERFLAAERVRGIWPDRVEVDLSVEAIRGLTAYEDAPSVRWQPGALGGIFSRLLGGGRRRR